MRKYIAADIALFALNELYIGLHSFLGEILSEKVVYIGITVQSSELGWSAYSSRVSEERKSFLL